MAAPTQTLQYFVVLRSADLHDYTFGATAEPTFKLTTRGHLPQRRETLRRKPLSTDCHSVHLLHHLRSPFRRKIFQ